MRGYAHAMSQSRLDTTTTSIKSVKENAVLTEKGQEGSEEVDEGFKQ